LTRAELHPSDHPRINRTPPATAGFLGCVAEPKGSAVEQLESRGLEEDAAHFATKFAVVSSGAENGEFAQLLAQKSHHRPETFLRSEQVGVEVLDALHE
jgi:hypothetical protein